MHIGRVDSDHSKVRLRVGADAPRRKDSRIVQRYFQLARTVDDVVVRENESIASDDKARPAARSALATQDANVHDGRRNAIDDRCDRPRIGVEKLIVAAAGRRRRRRREASVTVD